MSPKELAPVETHEKKKQYQDVDIQEPGGIKEILDASYTDTDKSTGNMDAEHDAKIIALKYLNSGYKKGKLQLPDGASPDIKAFADIRNQLGKDFFDNMLYKYDVPYDEILLLATELGKADEKMVEEMKKDLVGLLKDMHTDDATENGDTEEGVEKNVEKTVAMSGMLDKLFGSENLSSVLQDGAGEKVKFIVGKKQLDKKDVTKFIKNNPGFDKEFFVNTMLPDILAGALHHILAKDDSVTYEGKGKDISSGLSGLDREQVKKFGKAIVLLANECGISSEAELRKIGVDSLIQKLTKHGVNVSPEQKQFLYGKESTQTNKGDQAIDGRVQLVSLESKHHNAKEYDKFFVDRYADYKHAIQNQFKTPELAEMCPPAFTDSFGRGVMQWWYDKVGQKIESYNAGKPEDKKASVDQIRKWLNCSPFDPKGRQEIGVTEDVQQLLKNLQTAEDAGTGKTVEDLSTVPELMNFDSLTNFLNNPENYLPNAELCLTVDAEKVSGYSAAEAKVLANSLQKVIDAYENGRRPSDIEKVMDSFGTGFDKVNEVIAGMKENGMLDKLIKVFKLLFGSADWLESLAGLNEMKESELGVEKTVALHRGVALCNKGEKSIDALDKERTNAAKRGPLEEKEKEAVHDKMGEMLFKTDYLRTERNTSPRCKEIEDALGSAYTKMVGEGNDIYDLIAKNLLNETNYNEFISARGKGDANQAMGILEHSGMSPVIDEVSKDHNQDITSHKLYLKMILARMLGTKENAAGVVRAATNEVQKGLDVARELDALTRKVHVEVKDTKVFLNNIPDGDTFGIKIGTAEPVPYNHTKGVDIATLGKSPKFTLVKQKADKTWSPLVKMDIALLSPSQVKMAEDKNTATITGLEMGDYLIESTYMKDAASASQVDGVSVPTNNSPLNHSIDKTKGTLTEIRFKSQKSGLRQTIWKEKVS